MKMSVRLTLLSTFLPALFLAGCDRAAVDTPEYPVDAFLETTAYVGALFSPDKSTLLVSSNETGIFNLYALPVDGSEAEPLTRSTTEAYRTVRETGT